MFHVSKPRPHEGSTSVGWTIYVPDPKKDPLAFVREICQRDRTNPGTTCPDCIPPKGMQQVSLTELRQLSGDPKIGSSVFNTRIAAIIAATNAGLFIPDEQLI